MPEYISREAAKERFKCIAIVGTDYIMQRLDDVPAADVVEVRHGEWVDIGLSEKCSLCGSIVCWDVYGNKYRYSYCPNCGAKMDGKELG